MGFSHYYSYSNLYTLDMVKINVYSLISKKNLLLVQKMSHAMTKPTICICENKGADQLRSNCEADQRLCFRYTDSTIPLLSKSKISSL